MIVCWDKFRWENARVFVNVLWSWLGRIFFEEDVLWSWRGRSLKSWPFIEQLNPARHDIHLSVHSYISMLLYPNKFMFQGEPLFEARSLIVEVRILQWRVVLSTPQMVATSTWLLSVSSIVIDSSSNTTTEWSYLTRLCAPSILLRRSYPSWNTTLVSVPKQPWRVYTVLNYSHPRALSNPAAWHF